MEAEQLREIVAENRELEQKLTKKNEQYIFDLKKALRAGNLSEETQAIALKEILPQLVEGQKTGITARQLFGTVSQRAEAILSRPEEKPEATPVMMWLDNTLLLFGVLLIMIYVMSMISNGKSQSMGIATLVLGSMSGGYSFYLMYKYVYQYERPGANAEKRLSWWKKGAILIGAMVLWLFIFTGSALLPVSVNPILDPIVAIVLGALALVFRYFFKKKYNVQSSFTGR